jgi:phytoene synthase
MTMQDARYCELLTRKHARTFSLASLLLPLEKRRGTYALYAFCRVADDLVDRADELADRGALRGQLDGLRRVLDVALSGHGSDPVSRELAWAINRFSVPASALHELLDGVATDISLRRWDSWTELLAYCEGVAGCVGEMCTAVMGVQAGTAQRPTAVAHARALGVAMQLTNILRDIGEDAQRDRCYLPTEELREFGFSPRDVLDGTALLKRERWRGLMRHQIARARQYYETASPGIRMLDVDAQRCASACAAGYARILDVIERNGYDTFTRRARLGWSERALVLGRALLAPAPTTCDRAANAAITAA